MLTSADCHSNKCIASAAVQKIQPLPLKWKSEEPVWIDQWPLPQEKLQAAEALVQEQLQADHIEPSFSSWNFPIFVIKKKSGKWRLLHDLRKINEVIQPMRSLQCGLPHPAMIPVSHELVVVDLKDCYFHVPLAEQDKEKFAFTVPVLNNSRPTECFQWKVLPQGMLNSPTICQWFVDQALQPLRELFPSVSFYHYLDDIFAHSSQLPPSLVSTMRNQLLQHGLCIAPEKIQRILPIQYLGYKLSEASVVPAIPQIILKNPITLVELQQLLGHLNWVRPAMGLTTSLLAPLFHLLTLAKQPGQKIAVTTEAREIWQEVQKVLRSNFLDS